MKIKAKHIIIDRAEGLTTECGPRKTFNFASANACLRRMAETAPKGGCYDKTDFKIVYEDGEEYEGRIDLQHPSYKPVETIGKHVTDFARFYGGMLKPHELPSHIDEKQYEIFLSQYKPEDVQGYRDFLEKYSLED